MYDPVCPHSTVQPCIHVRPCISTLDCTTLYTCTTLYVHSWCGQTWSIGPKSQAGSCHGYISSPDNTLCFQVDVTTARDTFILPQDVVSVRYYVHCIRDWVDAGSSNLRITCGDDGGLPIGPRTPDTP